MRWRRAFDTSGLSGGSFYALFAFAPLVEPENPDTWAPLDHVPAAVLLISIERSWDAKVLQALAQMEREGVAVGHAGAAAPFAIDWATPIADVYEQMAAAGLTAFSHTGEDPDDMSFFLLRGGECAGL